MLLSFGYSEHRLDLTIPACSLNHLNINTIPEYSISTHCSIQAASTPTEETHPPLVWRRWCMHFECKSPVRSILACYSDALGTLTHRTRAVCENFTWLTTHRGSFQSSQDLGTRSNCFTDCYPLNLGWLLIHQDPSSKPPIRKMPWDLHLTGFTGGLCLSLGQFPFL